MLLSHETFAHYELISNEVFRKWISLSILYSTQVTIMTSQMPPNKLTEIDFMLPLETIPHY